MKLFSPRAGFAVVLALCWLTGCGKPAGRPASSISQKDHTMLERYEEIRAALAADDLRKAKSAANELLTLLKPTPDSPTPAPIPAVQEIADCKGLDQARRAFATLSTSAIKVADGVEGFYIMQSPIQDGAEWVQKSQAVDNPYAGKATHEIGMAKR